MFLRFITSIANTRKEHVKLRTHTALDGGINIPRVTFFAKTPGLLLALSTPIEILQQKWVYQPRKIQRTIFSQ